jgi:uncharacterized lipoprotein YmbA
MLLAACASTPAPHYYVLEPEAARESTARSPVGVLVEPVAIPQEVDRPQMVLSRSPGEVAIDDGHRWAAPLQPGITQVLARDIGRTLAADVVTEPDASPWTGYRVQVQIVEFSSRLGEDAVVEARWEVRREGIARAGTEHVREAAAGGYEGLAQAHSRALGRVAAAIAGDIRALDLQRSRVAQDARPVPGK